MSDYAKRWWKQHQFPKIVEKDRVATTAIEVEITSGRELQNNVQHPKTSYFDPLLIDSRVWNAMEKDKKSTRKAFKMINDEIEKIVCEMN